MTEHFFNKERECMSLAELRELQLSGLKKTVRHVYQNNAEQRARMETAGVRPDDVQALGDIEKLPFTNKDVFRKSYPLGLSCVPKSEIAEMHMSSGSTGTPVVMPYTKGDLLQWAECMARCYAMAGAEPKDTVQITPSFGLFNGGFGMYHGARALGMFVIPTGAGNTARQIKLARDFGTAVITGVVSYGIRIMEVMQEEGAELPELKIGIFGAEIFSESMKEKISRGLGIEAFDIYGMTETGGVGTLGMDCRAHDGLHIWEDHYLVELIDPETKKPVPDGTMGEITVTALTRQALPVIRFRTGDVSKVISREKCACGRTHMRLAPVTGRIDDMLIIKGVNFFPRQVEQVLLQIPGVGSNYQIIIEETHGVRDLRVNVEAEENVTGYMVEKALKEALGFSPKGDIYKIGELPRREGKAKRVFFENKAD